MKKYASIIIALEELIDLLGEYQGNESLVARLNVTRNELKNKNSNEAKIKTELEYLNRGLFGMGSITDRTFIPKSKTNTKPAEAKEQCDAICGKIRREIEAA